MNAQTKSVAKTAECVNAVYDLRVNPNSFDIAKFLVLAELARREVGALSIHLHIVPNEESWAKADDPHEPDAQIWRLRHIILPCVSLIPSISGYTVHWSLADARKHLHLEDAPVFPRGYRIEEPVSCFEWADVLMAADRGVPSLRAAPQARAYARQWIDAHAAGRRVVSLTMREMRHEPHRNNNHEAWYAFARHLKGIGYFPTIIRDTDQALAELPSDLDGLPVFPEAAFNIELRTGFYEECFLNLFVNNGPAELALLNTRVAHLMFMKYPRPAKGTIWYEDTEGRLPLGGEHPVHGPHQRTVWTADTLEGLTAEFGRMVDVLETRSSEIDRFVRKDVFPAVDHDPVEMCRVFVRSGYVGQADTILADLASEGAVSPDEATYLRGKVRLAANRPTEARPFLEQAVAGTNGSAERWEQLADTHARLGNLSAAQDGYARAIDSGADRRSASPKLAMVLNAMGKYDEAEALIRTSMDEHGVSPSALRILAETLKHKGMLREAVAVQLQAEGRG